MVDPARGGHNDGVWLVAALPRPILVVLGLIAAVAMLWLGAFTQSQLSAAAEPISEVRGARMVASTTTTVVPSTTVAATAEPTAATNPPPRLRTATLAFTGDTLSHRGIVRQAAIQAQGSDHEYDFAPFFREVQQYLAAADVAICHLETPLSPDNSDLSGYPTFNVPGDLARGLADAGYDGCTTASNHSLDRRPAGVVNTLDVLDAAGLSHSGMARSAEERAEATIYDANGIRVAVLSYTYGLNGFRVPADQPWLVNEIDVDQIATDAEAARVAGAEYVVVSLHWGTEYRTAPSTEQVRIAEALRPVDGIDLIVGHHAHVVQPVDQLDDRFVVYGLGNFLSNQSATCCAAGSQDGVIVQVHVQEERGVDGQPVGFRTWLTYVPTWVDRPDFTIIPVVDALADPDLSSARQATLAASRERTADALRLLDIGRVGLFEVRPPGSFTAAVDGTDK
jgi:poly-gamma-glutamate synthesis protein (capsule biosynthesis protein)